MLEVGQVFAHFNVLKKIGEGGMGEVFLVEDKKLNRRVALKVLAADVFDNLERQERFKREAKTAAQISHSNVMAIYDIGSAESPSSKKKLNYIVMEYIKGESLSNYLKSKGNDLTTLVRLAEKISSGLAAAHKMNIVHRDIKAENIIIDENGEPKILDFGLAKPLDSVFTDEGDDSTETVSRELTKAGKIMGTVSYMSPEQARGDVVDTRSDIFSFGILLYQMVTGEFPFSGPTQMSTLAKILESKQEPPRIKNESISPELERIIDKCLQKDPNDRYQDTRDLVIDLRSLRRQYESGQSQTISTEIVKPVKKNFVLKLGWKSYSVLALLFLLFFAFIKTDYFQNDSGISITSNLKAQSNSLAIIGFQNKTGDPELDWLQTGLPEILLTDLSQSKAINIISRERVLDCLPGELKTNHTFEQCADAARSLGAVHLLSGAFYKLGEKIRIDARIQDAATGNIVMAHKVVGEDPFSLVDSLTKKIAVSLNFGEKLGEDRDVATYTSSSPEAYKHYLKGLDLFLLELYDEAIEEFNIALSYDTTFALPYMRIGMSKAFQIKYQESAHYFARAREHETNLPDRERNLLDIYADLWLEQEFDDAFIKMESFVKRYSNDKEAHTIYALLIYAFTKDTLKAFIHLDTALQIDPTYQLALSIYTQIYNNYSNYTKVIEYTNRIRKYHPESPKPYLSLGGLYSQQMMYDEAITEYEEMLDKFVDDPEALYRLSILYILKRNFNKSIEYMERLKKNHSDNPFEMTRYYYQLSNINIWSGRFKKSMDMRFKAYQQAVKTNDSTHINTALNSIAHYYYRLGQTDSARYYYKKASAWARSFESVDYHLSEVKIDPSRADELRPGLQKSIKELKSRLPSELWDLIDNLENMFEAYASSDTAALININKTFDESQPQGAINNRRNIGKLLILTGKYEDGKKILEKFIKGKDETTIAYHYLIAHYYIGIAEEGLDNKKEAIKHYEEVLNYWGNADIEFKEIKDTRKRLAELTS